MRVHPYSGFMRTARCMIVLISGLMLGLCAGCGSEPLNGDIQPGRYDLYITNQNAFTWYRVRISLNDNGNFYTGYMYDLKPSLITGNSFLEPNTLRRFPLVWFFNRDKKMFDPRKLQVKRVRVWVKRDEGASYEELLWKKPVPRAAKKPAAKRPVEPSVNTAAPEPEGTR